MLKLPSIHILKAFPALALGLILAQLILFPRDLLAHAVYIFAYPNGDEVCTESYFTKKDRVKNGTISMFYADGTLIQSAKTDTDGNYCFPLPKVKGDLLFVIEAGEGHRGEFKLREEDLPSPDPATDTGSVSETEPAASAASSASGAASGAAGAPVPSTSSPPGASSASSDEIRQVVRSELKSQLGPIMRALAEQNDDKTPGLREIVGGLGWIVGLLGIITLARGRKTPKQ
ncbi:MAG: hypothetical protein LBE27_04650 [Deltaproteobacteria bacterium]|jgi:nickel transport protein|nr:hypothetical protein [Deltaproteobacteria bacterium]